MTKEHENFFCVISKAAYGEHAVHDIQTNSAWSCNPYGSDYAVVPDELVPAIKATRGFCDITLSDDGTEVVAFVAREIPDKPVDVYEPTAEDDMSAMLVDLEYRVTLIELGLIV